MRRETWRAAAVILAASLVLQPASALSAERGNAKGRWEKEGKSWSYRNEKGEKLRGWVFTDNAWHYLDPESGKLCSGWQKTPDGSWYFLNTAHDGRFGQMLSGWQWIEGYCYYFHPAGEKSGALQLSGKTEDGYELDGQGRWAEGGIAKYQEGRGLRKTEAPDPAESSASPASFEGKKSAGRGTRGGSGGGSGSSGRSSKRDEKTEKEQIGESGKGSAEPELKGQSSAEPGRPLPEGKKEESAKPEAKKSGSAEPEMSHSGGTEPEMKKSGSAEAETAKPGRTEPESKGQSTAEPEARESENPLPEGKKEEGTKPEAKKPGSTEPETEPKTPENKAKEEEQPSEPEKQSLLFEKQSRLVHLGFSDYVTAAFRSGTISDYSLSVDGTDITDSVRKVDDDGKIVKWESTVVSPKRLTVTSREDDSKREEILLSGGEQRESVEAGSPEDAPDYILARGRVLKYDRYTAPHDKEGRDRVLPSRTTFDLSGTRAENSDSVTTEYYVKPVLIDENGAGVEKDGITAKFRVDNEEQEKWFRGIDSIRILNSQNWPINRNPSFSTEIKDTKHGKNGIIKLPTGQSNMRSNGVYKMNIHSSYTDETVTVPFELVKKANFSMKQRVETANPKRGERIQFEIVGENGESFGNELRIDSMRVILKKPSGKKLTLHYIDDFFNFGGLFNLYGTSSNEEKTVNTDEIGVYTLELKYSGYQKLKTQFEVYPGESFAKPEKAEESAKRAARERTVQADAVSAATSGKISGGRKSGSGSLGGSGQYVDGRMVFNYDLLTNALILNELEIANQDSHDVVQRWFDTTEADYIYKDGAEKLYRFTDYLDAFKKARIAGGRSLRFTGYTEQAEAADYAGPAEVQNVLEDGSLGRLTEFKFYKGDKAAEFTGTTAEKGEDFLLSTENREYLSSIRGLYVDGQSQNLLNEYQKRFEIDPEKGTLKLFRTAFNFNLRPEVGEHTLRIDAGEKYRAVELKLLYTAVLEELSPELSGEAESGKDVTVSLKSQSSPGDRSYGDFLKNLSRVELVSPDQSGTRTLYTKSVGGESGNDYYETDSEKQSITLKAGLFRKAGDYELYLHAEGYPKPLHFPFSVKEGKEDPGEGGKTEEPETEGKAAPEKAELSEKKSIFGGAYQQLSFPGAERENLNEYLGKIQKLELNGTEYRKAFSALQMEENEFYPESDGYGYKQTIRLGSGAVQDGENSIRIQAEGYQTKDFLVRFEKKKAEGDEDRDKEKEKDKNKEQDPAVEKEVPTGAEAELLRPRQGYDSGTKPVYEVRFTGLESEELDQYLRSRDLKVSVNGMEYRKSQSRSYLYHEDSSFTTIFDQKYRKNGLALSANAFHKGENSVVVEAEGYRSFEFSVTAEEEESAES